MSTGTTSEPPEIVGQVHRFALTTPRPGNDILTIVSYHYTYALTGELVVRQSFFI